MTAPVAALFARRDSVYKTLPGVEVFDADRDALTFPGGMPVVAHPPCRAWGRLRAFGRAAEFERALAPWAVDRVREEGGVLEHPAQSTLWLYCALPAPGVVDRFGGFTLPIWQSWFGHRAAKPTWLYVVGVPPAEAPAIPLQLGEAAFVIQTRLRKGATGWRAEVTKREREATPLELALWLAEVARRCAST